MKYTGLAPLHAYLVMETSLLLAIDPKAEPLLTGKIGSLPGLLALSAALPDINPNALTFPISDLAGNLDLTYTLPKTHASDPNAACPPTTAQINSGLIGCGLATIDLTSFTPVGAGSAVVEYKGDPFFPPPPTLAVSPASAIAGQQVSVTDAPGATTSWWLSTRSSLAALLGSGAAPPPTVTVALTSGSGSKVFAPNTISVAPAVYNDPVLTPPKISGTFTVPVLQKGTERVGLTYQAQVLFFTLSISATSGIQIRKLSARPEPAVRSGTYVAGPSPISRRRSSASRRFCCSSRSRSRACSSR